MSAVLFFIGGLCMGLLVGGVVWFLQHRSTLRLLALKETEHEKTIAQLKESFSSLSLQALNQNTQSFLQMANETLAKQTVSGSKELQGKKEAIEQTLATMKTELDKVQKTVGEFEKDRQRKFTELTLQLKAAAEQTEQLKTTTSQLNQALSSSQVRGQWGERMAEDILRLSGLEQGIHYLKQSSINTEEGNRSRPDYTFYLPQKRVINMDVKFPLENYMNYLAAKTEPERDLFKKKFLDDARKMVTDVAKRGYIDANHNTLDYMLLFVPNEQVYAFLNEHDRTMIDNALQRKIILCSPMTLYAVLSVIHMAVENFTIEQKAAEIQAVLGNFKKQWEKFSESFDKVGKKIRETQTAFEELTTTRRNALDRQLNKVDTLQLADNKHTTSATAPYTTSLLNTLPADTTEN